MRSVVALALLLVLCTGVRSRYVGRSLGRLTELHHGVRGHVYAVDSRTLYIQDLHYDGEGPAAYFYVGSSKTPNAAGATRLRDERGGTNPLRRYRGEGVTLSLPDSITLHDVKWFALWCDEYSVNFGDVSIPRDLEYPKPAKVGSLRGVHGVSSDPIVVVDAQTLLVPNFSYDGEAPDAKFWVGRGEKPSPQGIRIPDENGKEAPLRKYDKKTIVLTLPGELTVFDIGHFAVWCEAFTVNFGHVSLPHDQLANVPPSLKMLGVSPQSKLNCEVLHDELAFEVRWAVAGDSIVLQLVAKLEDGEYMSFGVSGDPAHSQMVGGDVAVAWVDKGSLKGYAHDYYLDAKSQCAGVRGSCPDERLGEKTNSIRLLNAALVNGYSIVTYQRSLRASDELDRPVLTNTSQPIIWALGPLNSRNEVSYHHHFTKGDKFIEFGRPPVWNCPMPEGEDEHQAAEPTRLPQHKPVAHDNTAVIKPNPVPTPKPVPKSVPWEIPAIQCYEPPDGVFYAQMGPTGGKQGYPAITGHVGWGISWYVNGLLIPEINVVRGKKYTFVVEGGSDPDTPARYHPFYITNDPVGGYYHKTDKEKQGVEIYAGVRRTRSGETLPTGVGRLCNWTPDNEGPEADEYPSFGAYQRSLTLVCEEGNPGVVTWTPDRNTPDTVYYQCFTHRYLGWKINVVDECDATDAEESRVVESIALPDDLVQEESVQVHNRVKPDANFLDQRKKIEKIINTKHHYNDFSSDKEDDSLTGEIYRQEPDRNQLFPNTQEYESPISNGQIKEVIQAVETLESQMKDNFARNMSSPYKPLNQYQVHEDVKEQYLPEQPIREGDEYIVETARVPDSHLLPPNQKPLTLQSVLRPNGPMGKPMGNMRPPFRRPVPPEIKLRRPPPPMYHKGNTGMYPLPMPNQHGPPHGMQKKPYKHNSNNNNRIPPNMNRPPAFPPMKSMPPMYHSKLNFNQGPPKQVPKVPTNGPVQSIIMGKPAQGNVHVPPQSQTLSLGQTDIIANQVVKSQITLPGSIDALPSQSAPPTYFSKPGQIILGKPMEHPVPLDQQMIPTKQHPIRTPPTPAPEFHQFTTLRNKIESEQNQQQQQSDLKSSDFMGESAETSTILPAVNTGFKPSSIVVESGFKPIIREPLMDRLADYDGGSSNRREDTDVEEDYNDSPQPISNNVFSNVPSDKITQSFEPMFIPSPLDHILPTNDRTKEIFPSNHAKEDRPHPVYVKSESELNALFSKKNMEKDVPSEMVMDSDKVSPQYLPPDPKLPKGHSQKIINSDTFVSYDGKLVSAATLTEIPGVNSPSATKQFSSKVPFDMDTYLKSPQFRPFKGDIPPAPDANLANKSPKDSKDLTTRLKLVNSLREEEQVEGELKAEASEVHEIVKDEEENDEDNESIDDEEIAEEYDEEEEEEKESNRRHRRDTKTAQFERGEVEEQTTGKSHTKNHVDFDNKSVSSSTRLYLTNLVLLSVLLKFL